MKKVWVPLAQRERLPFWRVLAIGSGTLVASLLWAIIFTLFQPLCSSLRLSDLVRGFLLFWASLAGFIINPVLGVWSDGLTLKWGRRRIFMLTGGAALVISMFLMAYSEQIGKAISPKKSLPAEQGIFISAFLIVCVAGNIIQAPARALCSDIIPHQQQVLMANVVQIYGGVSGILTNLCGGLKLYKYTSMNQNQFILVICLSLSAVALTVSIISSPEEPLEEKKPSRNPFPLIWQAMKKMPSPFLRMLPAHVFAQTATYQYGYQFSDFMGRDIFKGDNTAPKDSTPYKQYQDGVSHAMMCNVVYFGAQMIWGFLNTKICEVCTMRWVFMAAMGLLWLIYGAIFFISNKWAFLGLSVILGIANCIYNAVPYAIVTLCIPTEDLGANLGIVVCGTVFGQQLSNFAIGTGLGHVWPDNPRNLLGISCAISLIACIFGFMIITPQKRPNQLTLGHPLVSRTDD
jgi:solute carrier family 45 protein 1/2/4